MGDFCGKRAQHIGVAKVRKKPQRSSCRGAFTHGTFLKSPLRSREFIIIGVNTASSIEYNKCIDDRFISGEKPPIEKASLFILQTSANIDKQKNQIVWALDKN